MPIALKKVFQGTGPAIVQQRLSAADPAQRGRVEPPIANLIGDPHVEPLPRRVLGRHVARVAFSRLKDRTTTHECGIPIVSATGQPRGQWSERSEISRECLDLCGGRRRPRTVHRVLDRRAHLVFEPLHRACPRPWARGADAQERRNLLGCSIGSIAERVALQSAGVPVGVAAMAAHPAIVGKPAIKEQTLAAVGKVYFRGSARAMDALFRPLAISTTEIVSSSELAM